MPALISLCDAGIILHVPVANHLIITGNTSYSFVSSGLLAKLKGSKRYVLDYIHKARAKKEVTAGAKEKAKVVIVSP